VCVYSCVHLFSIVRDWEASNSCHFVRTSRTQSHYKTTNVPCH
jgi:hypothetical protein